MAYSENPHFNPTKVAEGIRRQLDALGQRRLDYEEDKTTAELPRVEVSENRPRPSLRYQQIDEACREGNLAKAGTMAEEILAENPDDLHAVYLLSRILVDSGKPGIAQSLAKRLITEAPHKPQGWLMLGAVEATLQRPEESILAIEKCLEIEKGWAEPYRCLSSSLVLLNRLDEAEAAAWKAMEFEDHHIPRAALAFIEMHRRNWKAGWEHYRHQLGRVKHRDMLDFGLPEWQGENERGSLLVYAEQGLGDQLCYVSAIEQCKQLVCHPKLESLLRRSLPNVEVYGEQFKAPVTFDITSKYQTSMASAMRWQEVKRRGRWLVPHPEKKIQWRALMDSKERYKGAPWVGIGWTGGSIGSAGWKDRNLKPHDLKPILDLPLNFVSLEYRPHTPPPGVHMWPWGTQTPDYEDTAALVDNLQAVVSVPTTVYHLAGSLGIPAHVIVHRSPHFHEGIEGDSPWWSSVSFYRRTEMSTEECVQKIADKLKELI